LVLQFLDWKEMANFSLEIQFQLLVVVLVELILRLSARMTIFGIDM